LGAGAQIEPVALNTSKQIEENRGHYASRIDRAVALRYK